MFMPVWFQWFPFTSCDWRNLRFSIGIPLARFGPRVKEPCGPWGEPCLIVHLDHQKVSTVTFGFLVRWVGLIPDASQHPYIRKDMRQDMKQLCGGRMESQWFEIWDVRGFCKTMQQIEGICIHVMRIQYASITAVSRLAFFLGYQLIITHLYFNSVTFPGDFGGCEELFCDTLGFLGWSDTGGTQKRSKRSSG